jgi:hypothetical protein
MDNDFKPSGKLILPKNAGKLSGPEGLGLWAKWEVEIRDGARLLDKREGPSHSFTKNFGKMMRGLFDHRNDVNESLTDRAGAPFAVREKSNASCTGNDQTMCPSAAILRFGNSAAALDSNQFDLQGTILSLTFGATTTSLIVEDNVQTQFKSEGQVVNTTGGPFTVQEMGLYGNVNAEALVLHDTLLLRDLTGPIIVANGLTILGRWTFTLAV